MTSVETPQSFVIRQECERAAFHNGFRRNLGETEGWAAFGSTTVPGIIHLAAASKEGPWLLALDHLGVINELDLPRVEMQGSVISRHAFDPLGQLYSVLPRVYLLAASLPDAPLQEFEARVKYLPTTTEAERLIVQRVGQDIFRDRLMDYWQSRCPLTGITDKALLRASHIVPWKDFTSDAERLDVHNGLLLSALWDAAFDRGLVTFNYEGVPEFSSALSVIARSALQWLNPFPLTDQHKQRLEWHRANVFADAKP